MYAGLIIPSFFTIPIAPCHARIILKTRSPSYTCLYRDLSSLLFTFFPNTLESNSPLDTPWCIETDNISRLSFPLSLRSVYISPNLRCSQSSVNSGNLNLGTLFISVSFIICHLEFPGNEVLTDQSTLLILLPSGKFLCHNPQSLLLQPLNPLALLPQMCQHISEYLDYSHSR